METFKKYNSKININSDCISIILAAGHGKRIKSETSKMLHEIYGVTTVKRVADSVKTGLNNNNQIIVVGIKAEDVVKEIGRNPATHFAFQEKQLGTGHAIQIALHIFKKHKIKSDIYIFPGDMGLLTREAAKKFKTDFKKSRADMMVLTSIYTGDPVLNYYGRIVRVPLFDIDGTPANDDEGKVIEIKEHKDILALKDNEKYKVFYNKKIYAFTKKELIENNEYNSGVFAFKGEKLNRYVYSLKTDNVQKEMYITDLIDIFNKNKLTVEAAKVEDSNVTMAFNNKSVLKEMETIFRKNVYEKLKDIIFIKDETHFFIAEEVIEQILKLDKKCNTDIIIEEGAYIGKDVKINKGLVVHKNTTIKGNIVLGKNVVIFENVELSTYNNQTMKIGDNTQIYANNFIKGNTYIGNNVRIESGVNITGSDEFPVRIHDNVFIKGTSYIFGSAIDKDVQIERSVIIKKHVKLVRKPNGEIQKIRFVSPQPEGFDCLLDL